MSGNILIRLKVHDLNEHLLQPDNHTVLFSRSMYMYTLDNHMTCFVVHALLVCALLDLRFLCENHKDVFTKMPVLDNG